MKNASARNMWGNYLDMHLEHAFENTPETRYFGATKIDADILAELTKTGIKKATSHALLGLQNREKPLPKIGDFIVVTNWEGEAQCIVRTTAVKLKPYFSIDAAYAQLEGEGDKSLEHWKNLHWQQYTKELETFGRVPRESMIIVCQEFEKVF